MSKEEKNYLAKYSITDYERPSVAVDMSVFSIMENLGTENYRRLPQKELKILMIKRASFPYKGCWALPGGFCRPGEDVCETAKRELKEETGIADAYLNLIGTFGNAGRDPRGWIISNAFMALINGERYRLRAGTDAWEAKWFSVNLKRKELKKEVREASVHIENEYVIQLYNEEAEISLSAGLKEYKEYINYHEKVHFEVLDSEGIAFDHAKLILYSLLTLRSNVKDNMKLVFDLMPEQFTLTQLQNSLEVILDEKLLTANFRRKINDYVIETEQIVEGAGHRPAKLFKRNIEEFYR